MNRGISCGSYHAGWTDDARERIQDSWQVGAIRVIVATIAFGMGINKPDVRTVIHFSISKSMEMYYQEAGRAGRDGKPSRCVILYDPDDVLRVAAMAVNDIEQHSPEWSECGLLSYDAGAQTRPKVLSMANYCHNFHVCRKVLMVEHLSQSNRAQQLMGRNDSCDDMCDVCQHECYDQCYAGVKVSVEAIEGICEFILDRSSDDFPTVKQLLSHKTVKQHCRSCEIRDEWWSSWLILELLVKGVLSITHQFTPYSTICRISGSSLLCRISPSKRRQIYQSVADSFRLNRIDSIEEMQVCRKKEPKRKWNAEEIEVSFRKGDFVDLCGLDEDEDDS